MTGTILPWGNALAGRIITVLPVDHDSGAAGAHLWASGNVTESGFPPQVDEGRSRDEATPEPDGSRITGVRFLGPIPGC